MSSLINAREEAAVQRFDTSKAMAVAAVRRAVDLDVQELCAAAAEAIPLLEDGGFIMVPERLKAAVAKVRWPEVPVPASIEAAL